MPIDLDHADAGGDWIKGRRSLSIVAARPGGDLLIYVGPGLWLGHEPPIRLGRILHPDGRLSPPLPLEGVLARGYWEPPCLDAASCEEVLTRARAALSGNVHPA